MKILKHGEKTETTTINAVFNCYKCGCKWLANIANECKKDQHEYYGYLIYCCNCPECGQRNVTTQTTNKQG